MALVNNRSCVKVKSSPTCRESDGTFSSTHMDTDSIEYNTWRNMLYRCRTSTAVNYHDYGGRGIKVCLRWESYELFLFDMGRRPSIDYTIERVDCNGDYEPSNCIWANKKAQSRNRRNSQIITIGKERLQIDDYCEKYGVNVRAIKSRFKRNWSMERIVNTPVRKYKC